MSGRSSIMMYGGPPQPQQWVKPAPKTTTSGTIPNVPEPAPAPDLTGLHPCLQCKRMLRGEVCPFCLREALTKMIAAITEVSTSVQVMSAELQTLKTQLATRRKKRQSVPANPDRARKKRP